MYTFGEISDYSNEITFRMQMKKLSDDEFYEQNPELKTFDNGEGVFTLSKNRDVEIQEFEEAGRRINYFDPMNAAMRRLTAILDGKGNIFARYYISRVLDPEVARLYLLKGEGSKYYEEDLISQMTLQGYLNTGSIDEGECRRYNRFEFKRGQIGLRFVQYNMSERGVCGVIESAITFGGKMSMTSSFIEYDYEGNAKRLIRSKTSSIGDLRALRLWMYWPMRPVLTEVDAQFRRQESFNLLLLREYLGKKFF